MNCEDLINMKQIKDGMKLIAGEKGIRRNIRWIYFADCIQCLKDDFNLVELIHGGELVIVTNERLTDNDEKIIDMIKVMNKKEIAAFVINEGQISKRVKDYCNEIELPLYELSVNLHLIDLSQIVCKALVEEESNINSRERILSTILYSEHLQVEDVLEQAKYIGINLSGEQRIMVMDINENKNLGEGKFMKIQDKIKKDMESEVSFYGLKKLVTLFQSNYIVVLLPLNIFNNEILTSILKKIIKKVESIYKISLKVGVGTAYEYIEDLKKSYQEAKSAIDISNIMTNGEKIYFYESLGIYSLITQINNGKFLDSYVESKIGKLIKMDKMQEGDLCDTLETYLEHNCNANATSEALFIHRNTMRYRMDKIKKILDDDINNMSVLLELKLAFAIKHYRDRRDG